MESKSLLNNHRDRYINIGLNVAYYRKKKGLSQLDLSEKSGISRGFMSAIEASGMPVGMSFETFFNIADALEVEPHNLLEFR